MSAENAAPEEHASPERAKPQIDPSKDLWQNITANVKDAVVESTDQTVLVAGAPHSGKTSLIHRLIGVKADKGPKPTTALEYYYGKFGERNTSQVAHFWELAHGSELAQLSDVVLKGDNVHTTVGVVVVDCADPTTTWETATLWLKRLDQRFQELFQKMRSKNSSTPDKLLASAKRRIGEDHPDMDKLRLSGVPLVLVAQRLDLLKQDTVKTKLFVRSLRFLAHLYGASLIFTSQQEREVQKLLALMRHVIFAAPFEQKVMQFDSEKGGVLILAGKDTFADIGDPLPVTPSGFKPTGDGELDRWKAPFDDAFPPRSAASKEGDDDFHANLYDAEKGAGEVAVDDLRKQKDEELEQYRKATSKKSSEVKGE